MTALRPALFAPFTHLTSLRYDLPLVLAGIILLARARKFRALAALLAVPLYYLCVQSALHTEYRYVLAVHYFLFVLAAAALYSFACAARRKLAGIGRKG